jgi:hypothetical protein
MKKRKAAPRRASKRTASDRSSVLLAALERGDFAAAVKLSALRPKKNPGTQRKPAAKVQPQPRKPAPKAKAKAQPRKLPTAKAQPRKLTAAQRRRHENALRGAETRRAAHSRVTSRTRRVTVGKIQHEEIGFALSDILRGQRSGNGLPGTPSEHQGDLLRANVDSLSAPMKGRTVQVTYYVSIDNEDGSGTKTVKRVRRIYRNFRGREDIAAGVNPSVRYAYDEVSKNDGTLQGAYIKSFSLAVVDDGAIIPAQPAAKGKAKGRAKGKRK